MPVRHSNGASKQASGVGHRNLEVGKEICVRYRYRYIYLHIDVFNASKPLGLMIHQERDCRPGGGPKTELSCIIGDSDKSHGSKPRLE